MITIQELLLNRGLDKTARIKLVRHKGDGKDFHSLYSSDKTKFLNYQNSQSNDVFKSVDYIVSFIGEEGRLARFIGVYKINGNQKLDEKDFLYEMEEVLDFEDLKEKIVINWGAAALSWHQWFEGEKEVVEIRPGLHYKPFTDYFNFVLNFNELKEIITNQYKDWKQMLKATNGIYLITDNKSGKHYVGSTYNENGIWGRWSEYIYTDGHGDDKTLKEFVKTDTNYA